MTQTQRFEMPLPQGLVWVELPCLAPGNPQAQARALAAALPALRALEAWLGTDLPCPEPAAPAAVASAPVRTAETQHLCLNFHPASPLHGGRLVMPWAAVPTTHPIAADLPCLWPQVAAHVCVQTLPLQRIVAVELVAGAVLLLPAAFAAPWAVQLQPAGGSGGPPAHWLAAATWSPHEGTVLTGAGGASQAQAASDNTWAVWLAEVWQVDLRAWLGASGQHPAQIQTSQTQGHGLAAELRCGNQTAARGRLLPLGAGWGLRLEHVESLAPAGEAAWT